MKINENIVEWDVNTWKRAFKYWSKIANEKKIHEKLGLEIGARHGGTTLFFVKEFDVTMYCSDYGFPTELAIQLHQEPSISKKITYYDVDATQIPFEDNMFDFVIFKSVLGTIGSFEDVSRINEAMSEIHRILKPNGILFFAENLRASSMHNFARTKFVEWGSRWYYVPFSEMKELLRIYSTYEIKTTGFLSAFVPEKFKAIKKIISKFDTLLEWLPNNWHYVSFGHAIK
jgi:ubiquinone/menaquinone biosynthesis C-methylase UbiE